MSFSLLKNIRIISQIIFFFLFVLLIFFSVGELSFLIFLDPLTSLHKILVDGFSSIMILSLIVLILTIFLGRFFCGWICPFGTINHFISFLSKPKNKIYNKSFLYFKYLLFLILSVIFITGLNLFGLFDPLSLFSRIISFYSSEIQIFSVLFILIVIFLTLNIYKTRFFCNVICPTGALLGLLSKFSFLKIAPIHDCSGCNLCGKNCSHSESPYKNYSNSECLLCFNCVADCKTEKLNFEFLLSSGKNDDSVMPSRRKFLGSLITGLVTVPLLKTEISLTSERSKFLRPPGTISENDFLDKCLRCGLCTQACNTNFISPADVSFGIENLWTPVKKKFEGYCEFECIKCTEVCPTDAIKTLTKKEKQNFKIGTAIINKNLCYTYSDGINCTACYDKCPLQNIAIRMRDVDIWTYRGRMSSVKQIYISQDDCIGCGICENYCVRKDEPAIYVSPEDQERNSLGII